ncbi:DinB family protein [Nocardioides rubriscoriae]|uniref:DinB family protein n=1 Tax=Nocardioides rubriscoriae TaxID=642762 RepID=UPI0011DF11A9|nr:DinB family protein [Nocardioides rubriscoriae]
MTVNDLLREQLTFHWDHQVRPRLDGLTDAEYLWEPVPGAWNLRPGTDPDHPTTIDFVDPQPDPPPVTTIAWRLAHVVVGVLAARNASHFGGAPADYRTFPYATTAAGALDQLDREYAAWTVGVTALGEEGLERPVGAAEGPWSDRSYATLVLHVNREVVHHLAEVCLLRDLHAHQPTTGRTRG